MRSTNGNSITYPLWRIYVSMARMSIFSSVHSIHCFKHSVRFNHPGSPEMLDELLIVPTVITAVHSHVVREHNRRQDRERRAEVLDDAVPDPEEARGGENNPGQPATCHQRSLLAPPRLFLDIRYAPSQLSASFRSPWNMFLALISISSFSPVDSKQS